MQQLRALRVRRVLEDCARLRPRHEGRRVGREGRIDGRGRAEAAGAGEGGGPLGRVVAQEGARGGGAAHPERVVGEEAVEPFGAEVLDAVWIVSEK